jgi:hypothetical protein
MQVGLGQQILMNVGFEVLTPVVMKSTIFWDITPCSPLRVNRRFGGTGGKQELCLPPAFTLVSSSAYFSTLKIEAIFSFETSVDLKQNTRRIIRVSSGVLGMRMWTG